jgi:hypothetical protein
MRIGTVIYKESNKEVSVLPMSSTFTIKRSQIPKLVLFFIKTYIKGFFK